MEKYVNYIKRKCYICSDYCAVYKDKETRNSSTDSDYIAPVNFSDVGPRTIVTRSVTRRIEKYGLLKEALLSNFDQLCQYQLSNRLNPIEPNYYESEDSDVEVKRRRRSKKRRHSVGDSLKLDNMPRNKIKIGRYSESFLHTTREVSSSEGTIEKTECNAKNEPKVICSTCHLRKLLNLDESTPVKCASGENIKQKQQTDKRKPEYNIIHRHRAKSHENCTSQSKTIVRNKSEGVLKTVERSGKSVAKRSYENKTMDVKIVVTKLNQRSKSESNSLHVTSGKKSSEKRSSKIETDKMHVGKYYKSPPSTKKTEARQISQRRCTVSGVEKTESEHPLDQNVSPDKTQNTGEEEAIKKISQRRHTVSGVEKMESEQPLDKNVSPDKTENTGEEEGIKKNSQRRHTVSGVEKMESEQSLDKNVSPDKTENTGEEEGIKKISQRRHTVSGVEKMESEQPLDKNVSPDKTENTGEEEGIKKISQRRHTVSGVEKMENEQPLDKNVSPDKTENTGEEEGIKKISQRRKSESVLHVNTKEISMENNTPQLEAIKRSESKYLGSELNVNKIKQIFHRRASNICFKRQEICDKLVAENKRENTTEKIVTKQLCQRRKSESSILHIISKQSNKTSQNRCLESSSDTRLEVKKIAHRRSSLRNQKTPSDNLNSNEKSTDKSTKESESKQGSQKDYLKHTSDKKDAHNSDKTKKYAKYEEQPTSIDKVMKLELKKVSEKSSGSGTSHKSEKTVSKNVGAKSYSRNVAENSTEEILTKKLCQRRKSESSILHIIDRQKSNENLVSKSEPNKISQNRCLESSSDSRLEVKKIAHRRSSLRNQKTPSDNLNSKEKSTEKSTKKSEPKKVSQKDHIKHTSDKKDAHNSDKNKRYSKYGEEAKSIDKVINLDLRKISEKSYSSGTSHKSEKTVSKNVDTKSYSKNVDNEKRNERSNASHDSKKYLSAGRIEKRHSDSIKSSHSKRYSEPHSHHKNEKCEDSRKRSSSTPSHSKEREHSKHIKTHSKQDSDEKKRTHSEKPIVSSDSVTKTQKGESEGKKSHIKEDTKRSSGNMYMETHKKLDPIVSSISTKKSQKGESEGKKSRVKEDTKRWSGSMHMETHKKLDPIVSSNSTKKSQKEESERKKSHVEENTKRSSGNMHMETHKKLDAIVSSTKKNQKGVYEGEKSHVKVKDTNRSSGNVQMETHKKFDKDTRCSTPKQMSSKNMDLLPLKTVSFEKNVQDTVQPMCKSVVSRRKSDSAALMSSSSDSKQTHISKKRSSDSVIVDTKKCQSNKRHKGSGKDVELKANTEKAQQLVSTPRLLLRDVAEHENEPASTPTQRKRTFNLNITSEDAFDAADKKINLSVISIVSSDDDSRADENNLWTIEDQLKEIFRDSIDSEQATKDLIRILSTSTESLSAAFEKSMISDAVQKCLESHSPRQGTSKQVITVVDNCGHHSKQILNTAGKKYEARHTIVGKSNKTDTAQNQDIEKWLDGVNSDMTKMEHYKKRLIHQHEKPSTIVSPASTTVNESDSPPQSPTNLNENDLQERKREDTVHPKVSRKRPVCRSKFRHENLELFKLGSSIPTSLCKTKEPYIVCTEKNLQLCYQNQNGKKCEENTAKESITESILNTMDGNKRKEPLSRSVSFNTEKSDKQNKSSNIIESSKNYNGRHVLPAIVPEIPDRRKPKTPNPRENKTSANEKGKIRIENDLVIRKADPISINKKRPVAKRRKTVTGMESYDSGYQNVNVEAVSNALDQSTDLESVLGRESVTPESEITEYSTISSSLGNDEHSHYIQRTSANVHTDPRLLTKPPINQYLKRILPKQYNIQEKPTVSSVETRESTKATEHSIPFLTQNRESTINYNSGQLTRESQNPENGRLRISHPSAQSTPLPQNHEPERNYVARSLVQNQPSTSTCRNRDPVNIAGVTPISALAESYEPKRNTDVGSSTGYLFQNNDLTKNYFNPPCTSSNASVSRPSNSYIGANFPHIQQQLHRFDNPSVTLPTQNNLINGGRVNLDAYRPVKPPTANIEEVIKTIIDLVKSSMDPNFSIEILLILNKWYIELKTLGMQRGISRKTKTAISKTLNDVAMYVSDKLFGVPCNPLLKTYVERIIFAIAPHHKELLTSLLPLMKRNYVNEQWINNVIKLFSQSLPIPLNDARNLFNFNPSHTTNQQNIMYDVPITGNDLHQPQNYFEAFHHPPLPYQGFQYQNPVQGNYLSNTNPPQIPGMLTYPPNLMGAVMEMQRNQHNMQTLFQNTPQNFLRPDSCNIVSTPTKPEVYITDNRCVPPTRQHSPEQSKVTKYKPAQKDMLEIIPIMPPTTSTIRPMSNNSEENHAQKVINAPYTERNNSDASEQNKTISCRSLEIFTSSNNSVGDRMAPDVEELLQTNFIYNNGRTGTISTDETASVTIESQSAISDNSQVQEGTNINNQENNKNEVASAVIVKDTSMEITIGASSQNVSSQESTNNNRGTVSNVIILEKLPPSTETDTAASTSISDNLVENKRNVKDDLKVELYDLVTKMKEKLQLFGGHTDVKWQVFQDVFEGRLKDFGDYKKLQSEKNKAASNEVITIDDDEDVLMEKVPDMQNVRDDDDDGPPKLIKLLPTKRRKQSESDQERQEKKLKIAISSSTSDIDTEIIISDDDEKEDIDTNIKAIQSNSDCNQNYVDTLYDAIKKEEFPTETSEEVPNSVTTSNNPSVDELTPATPRDVIELTDSPVINHKPSSSVIAEAPMIEDISSDEEPTEKFCPHNSFNERFSSDEFHNSDKVEFTQDQ